MENAQLKKRFDYKWVIFVLSIATVFTALGMFSGNRSLYIKPITEALGMPRGLYGVTDTFRYAATTVLNILFGTLIIKFGPKKLMGCGFAASFSSLMLYSCATTDNNTLNLVYIYAAGLLFGICSACCTTNVISYIIGTWFKENKGTYMGIVLAANGLGTAVTAPIIKDFLYSGKFGYVKAFRFTAICVLVVGVIVMIFMREAPKGEKLEITSTGKKRPSRGSNWEGVPFSQVIKKPYFYIAGVLMMLTGFTLQAIHGTTSAYFGDLNIDKDLIALSLSVHSVCLVAAKVLAGISFDRLGLRKTLLIMYVLSIIGAVLMVLIEVVNIPAFAVAADALFAFAMPLETIMLPLIALGLFGNEPFAKTMGYFSAFCTAGFAFASPVTNAIFDAIKTYRPIYLVMIFVLIAIAVTFQIIIPMNYKAFRTAADK